jgi:hypothetical protein
MIRELHELKAVGHEARQLQFAARKLFARGPVPDPVRARFRSRLFLVKSRVAEVAKLLREAPGLTGNQQIQCRRELGQVRACVREIDRMLATPAVVARAGGNDASAPARAGAGPPPPPAALLTAPPPRDLTGRSRCPICSDTTAAGERGDVPCPLCGVLYHPECWEYFGGCAIYGCAGAAPPSQPDAGPSRAQA